MGLGLVGLLAFLQTGISNPPVPPSVPYDSSRVIAERIASYLMENGKKMVNEDSTTEGYITCWIKDFTYNDQPLMSSLCKLYDPKNLFHRNSWFLEFVQARSDTVYRVANDLGVNGNVNVCAEIIGKSSPQRINGKECSEFYESLLNSVNRHFLKEK